jgi:hypothetical protein
MAAALDAEWPNVRLSGLVVTRYSYAVSDADIGARMRIRPAGDITCGKDSWHARFEIAVHQDSPISGDSGRLGKLYPLAHANSGCNEIGG